MSAEYDSYYPRTMKDKLKEKNKLVLGYDDNAVLTSRGVIQKSDPASSEIDTKPVLIEKSKYLGQLDKEDLSDFFLEFGENIDTTIESLDDIIDNYFTIIQLHEQLDANYENIPGDKKSEAKRRLIKYKEDIDYYQRLLEVLKKHTWGTEYFDKIPAP
ncbi:MAG: hypothetical protein WCP14_03540 [bacterium]